MKGALETKKYNKILQKLGSFLIVFARREF
jgi:hypothetical protein